MSTIQAEIRDYSINVTLVDDTDVIEAKLIENVINVTFLGGSSEGARAYTHTQGVASTVRTIVHNLGFNPGYTAIEHTGDQIEGHPERPDTNTMTITFSASVRGVAYLS